MTSGILITLGVAALLAVALPAVAQEHGEPGRFPIPESMRAEHAEIHAALEEATRAPGPVGEAARHVVCVEDRDLGGGGQPLLQPPHGLPQREPLTEYVELDVPSTEQASARTSQQSSGSSKRSQMKYRSAHHARSARTNIGQKSRRGWTNCSQADRK